MIERESKADLELARRIYALATDKGALIRVSPTEYLIGILEGRYPRFTNEELASSDARRNHGICRPLTDKAPKRRKP